MTARILIADDDASVQRSLMATLRQEGYEVLTASNGAEAIRLWATEQPDMLIVDATLGDLDGYAIVARVREGEVDGGHLPVILLSGDGAVSEKVRALRAGADELVVKPFLPAELLARVRGLLGRFPASVRAGAGKTLGRISAFYGAKGGVGTTTVAINTAIALHRELGRRVALVDGNLQFGDLQVFLDLGRDRKGLVDVVSAPQIDEHLVETVLFRDQSGVQVLLGPPSPETAELVTAEHLPQVLGILRNSFDHVIVDLDRRLDDTNLHVLDAADRIHVVMTADLSCLKNVGLLLDTIGQLGYEDDKVQIVLNRSTAMTGIGARNVESVIGRPIAHQIVNEYRTAITALNKGRPFMASGGAGTPLGRSIVEFAKGIDGGTVAPRLLTSIAGG